jgi:8-oxo-dGTP diphosphatase
MNPSPDDAGSDGRRSPIPAVLAVVLRDGEVVLVRRANPPDAGLWGFPGGKIEFGERVEDAAIRELAEETGIAAEPQGVITVVDAIEPALGLHYVLVAVLCRWVSGEPIADDDALEARWFDIGQLGSSDIVMSDGVVEVADLARSLAARAPGEEQE